MAITARSLKSSGLEGKKFSGGSIKALSEEEEEGECVDLECGFGRFLGVEGIDDGWCWMDLPPQTTIKEKLRGRHTHSFLFVKFHLNHKKRR